MKRNILLLIVLMFGLVTFSQSADQNYVQTTVYKVPETNILNLQNIAPATARITTMATARFYRVAGVTKKETILNIQII